jgi:hypothetical protein
MNGVRSPAPRYRSMNFRRATLAATAQDPPAASDQSSRLRQASADAPAPTSAGHPVKLGDPGGMVATEISVAREVATTPPRCKARHPGCYSQRWHPVRFARQRPRNL